MPRASQYAKLLLQLASEEAEPELITHLRLQKLLYYIQGWSLALRGEPAFREPIEAWRHGPVVADVYREFGKFGDNPIPYDRIPAEMPEGEKSFTLSIWEAYKRYSAIALRDKTHAELPWLEARKGFADSANSQTEISQGTMSSFFQQEFRKTEIPGLELETAIKLASPDRPKRGKPLAEILLKYSMSDAPAPH